MASLIKKICLIGDFAVGKTSLVSRYVNNVFSDKYLTTVGVKIDTKLVSTSGGSDIKLVIWDIAGTDSFTTTDIHYLQGASAYLLVVDGSRRNTLDTAQQLKKTVDNVLGSPPFVMVFNKSDLRRDWEIEDSEIETLLVNNWLILKSSAKSGENVAQAFKLIAERLTDNAQHSGRESS